MFLIKEVFQENKRVFKSHLSSINYSGYNPNIPVIVGAVRRSLNDTYYFAKMRSLLPKLQNP